MIKEESLQKKDLLKKETLFKKGTLSKKELFKEKNLIKEKNFWKKRKKKCKSKLLWAIRRKFPEGSSFDTPTAKHTL